MIPVDDPADPRLADYVGLTDAELRRRHEAEAGVFIAEGTLVIRALVRSPYRVRSVLVTPKRLEDLRADLGPVDAPVYVASLDVLRAVAGFDLHRGAVAAVDRPEPVDPWAVAREAASLLVLEGISDTENMGSLFRNAAAFGAGAVLLAPGCCDPLYRRAVRVSMGHVLTTPFAWLPSPVAGAAPQLRALGFTVLALTPDPSATSIDAVAAAPPARLAVLLGAEGPGLRADTLDAADARVRIPIRPGVDSLNVATAAAIALHRLRKP